MFGVLLLASRSRRPSADCKLCYGTMSRIFNNSICRTDAVQAISLAWNYSKCADRRHINNNAASFLHDIQISQVLREQCKQILAACAWYYPLMAEVELKREQEGDEHLAHI
jgi:hypothetical protein